MTVDHIDVDATLKTVEQLLAKEAHLSPALRSILEVMIVLKIDDPDEIKALTVDRSTLPPGEYRLVGFDCRQVFDIDIRRVVTEYQAEILENPQGQRFTAPFPAGVTKAVQ